MTALTKILRRFYFDLDIRSFFFVLFFHNSRFFQNNRICFKLGFNKFVQIKINSSIACFFLFLFLFFFYTPSSKIQHYISSSLYIKCLLCMCAHIQSCVVCIHVYLCASLDTCACCVPCLSTKFRSRTKPMHCPLPACILHLSLPSLLNNPYSFSLTYTLKIKKNKKYILIN